MNYLLEYIFSIPSSRKRVILFTIDSMLIPLSFLLALAARLETYKFLTDPQTYIACFIVYLTSITIFFRRRFYDIFVRHISIEATKTIIFSFVTAATLLLLVNNFFSLGIPRSVPFIFVTIASMCIAATRFFISSLGQKLNSATRQNVVVYGARSEGRQIVEALKWNSKYRVCQIIDDGADLKGKSLAGIKIQNFNEAKQLFKSNRVGIAILATPPSEIKLNNKVLDDLASMNINIKIAPNLDEVIGGISAIEDLPNIDIEDLLGRKKAEPNEDAMARSVTGKFVLVTGAGGSIGSELCRQITNLGPKNLILLDISEYSLYELVREINSVGKDFPIVPVIGSVQDRQFLRTLFQKFQIDTIFHAAAYKHVSLMEQNVLQCFANNVLGTADLANEAINNKIERFVLVSTDKAVNPTNFMGASKRCAELLCRSFAQKSQITHFSIVRFGNVLGSSGSVVPLFKEQIASGGPVTVTHKSVKRYFMTIPEAAELVIQASSIGSSGDTLVLDMGEQIRIVDLAKKMIMLSGKMPVMGGNRQPKKTGEVEISFTGLRPGEKLEEELAYDGNLVATEHPRIMLTQETEVIVEDVDNLLENLKTNIEASNVTALISTLNQVFVETSTPQDAADFLIV